MSIRSFELSGGRDQTEKRAARIKIYCNGLAPDQWLVRPIEEVMRVRRARRRESCKRWRLRQKALKHIAAVDVAGSSIAADAIHELTHTFSSEGRIPGILPLLRLASPPVFWRVFHRVWSGCDDTWHYKPDLLKILRRNQPESRPNHYGPPPHYTTDEDDVYLYANELFARDAYWDMPERFVVFRGCDQSRVRGLSWTTKRRVADTFAHGHRGIRYPNPVVATAWIAREHVFSLQTDRGECEVVLDPWRLIDLRIGPPSAERPSRWAGPSDYVATAA